MRLIDPAPGEVIDRITILHLKITKGNLTGGQTSHWEGELAGLMMRLEKWTLRMEWFAGFFRLAAINGLLWDATEKMEDYSVSYLDNQTAEVAALGVLIFRLNHLRALNVSEINQWMGRVEERVREKQ